MKLSVRPAGAFLLLAVLSACDVPTGIPRWDTTWMTPAERTTVSVAELLPAAIELTPDSSAFVLGFDAVSASFQLSDFCPGCQDPGVPVPKPAFTATLPMEMPLPPQVESVDIVGGGIAVELAHGFDFDPIRPGASADSGSITITVTSGTEVVASLVIDGRDRAFAPGDTIVETLSFDPATVQDTLDVEVVLDSPAGDNTTMDSTDEFSASLSSDGVLVSEAAVDVNSVQIGGESVTLDFSDVDIGDRVTGATFFLDIENPFGVTGSLDLIIDPEGAAGPYGEAFALQPGTTEASVQFDEQEIQTILGTTSDLTVQGTVNGGTVTVRPDMVMSLETRVRFTIEVGGELDEDSGS